MHAVCMQRWLAMAKPPVGAVDHGLATCKGRSPAGAGPSGQPVRGYRPRPALPPVRAAAKVTTVAAAYAGPATTQ
ncbi:hypothetical protein B296_00015222 [Ensete ventricosum]|uniref:Uncharacterized protein n=1 Tax=Ensete ventricosum TaxID=4639 RepID=A0A426Z4Y1_ENSVE|nr:hypothetical protein B296_00015222 [Ensete ventricosum]